MTCPHELDWVRERYPVTIVPCTSEAGHGGPHANVAQGVVWAANVAAGTRVAGEPTDMTPGMTAELTDNERTSLPARFHRPHFDSLGTPHSWICEVCWGEGWQTSWPCGPARSGGVELALAMGVGCSR